MTECDAPKGMMPVTQYYYTHIVIEVSSLDDLTPRFEQTGFYKVRSTTIRAHRCNASKTFTLRVG
jgi:hypothetical protein